MIKIIKFKNMRGARTALAALLLGACANVAGSAEGAKILLIGTYHFSNPGQDLNNVKAEDVLTPERQKQLLRLAASLSHFKPTKVAVEWPAALTDERYAKYVAGTLPASHNEVVQLGFRLAHANGLTRVFGVDVDGEFPFDEVAAWAKSHDRQNDIDQVLAVGAAEAQKLTALQQQISIGAVLYHMNEPQAIAVNQSFYPPMLRMGQGEDQPGAKLIAAWQARNLQICARLIESIDPGDRVVVFFGQGHVYLLRQCLIEQPGVELINPLPYLKTT